MAAHYSVCSYPATLDDVWFSQHHNACWLQMSFGANGLMFKSGLWKRWRRTQCVHICVTVFFSHKRSMKCDFAQHAMTITPNHTLNETSLHITEQDTHSHQTRDCLSKTHQGSWKQRLLGHWWSWYRVSTWGYVRMELICKVLNTLPLLIIKDLSDRTLRWPSNLTISIVHQKNHQQPLGTTNGRVHAHQHPRYF